MFEIVRYTSGRVGEWNRFVDQSRNGTFLFNRGYMDYHSDRFADFSLMFYMGGRLLAVLPAHLVGNTLCSHKGLTYGGLLMSSSLTAVQTIALFQEMNKYLIGIGVKHVYYKSIPWIYHRLSAEEDLYALYHVCHARIVARDFASNIFLGMKTPWERVRRRGVLRALTASITVEQSNDFAPFWKVLSDNLGMKYGVKPVHSLSEIELLHSRFPDNIVLYNAVKDGTVVGGIVLYITPQVVHAQYSSATPEGKKMGAMDLLYDRILHEDYINYPFFDFGRSTENTDGSGLNEQLVFQKEGFGARGLCYDIYQYDL